MAECKGILHCNRKTCLEMSICEKTMDYSRDIYVKQRSPVKRQNAVLVWSGQKKITTGKKSKKRKEKLPPLPEPSIPKPHKCKGVLKWACEILGQCIFEHTLVKANKRATEDLKVAYSKRAIIEVIERLMPALNRGNWKKRNKKQ